MNEKTVAKLHMGETYVDAKTGKSYIWMGSTVWAVKDGSGRVIDCYTTKTVAQYNVNQGGQ